MQKEKTPISKYGEFGLIEHIAKKIKLTNKTTAKGIGDDAAVIRQTAQQTLVTSDLLMEGVHFDRMYTPLKHLGYKAAVVNFSDIYAMNGHPEQMIVALGISSRLFVEDLEEIYNGLITACSKYKVDIAGGDTSASLTGLTISITVIGRAPEENLVFRNTAEPGDIICVTGDLGAAYMGLQVLEREKQVFKAHPQAQPELEGYDYLLKRQLKPEARKDIIEMFAALNIKPTAMIDISDGLSSEMIHICRQSGAGCKLYEKNLPVDEQTRKISLEFNIDPTTTILSGGEDYELLFTIDPEDYKKINKNPDITEIGILTGKEEGMHLIARDGTNVPLTAQGWDALLKKME